MTYSTRSLLEKIKGAMKKDKVFRDFLERVGRGRKFEEWERSQWVGKINAEGGAYHEPGRRWAYRYRRDQGHQLGQTQATQSQAKCPQAYEPDLALY